MANKPQQFSVQFTRNTRVATLKGNVVRLKAYEPRVVTEDVYRTAMTMGGIDGNVKLERPSEDEDGEDENVEHQEEVKEDSGVLEVARAMREIIDSADPDKLTSGGEPKISSLEEAVGFEVNSALRTEAQKLLDEGIA